MTAEEKAKQLIDLFFFGDYRQAKQCAAICVENIIAECKFLGTADYRLPYWEEVLTKINKL